MNNPEEIANLLFDAVHHTMTGNGPASVRLKGAHGMEDGAVVFVMPGPLGVVVDDALGRLYALLGWRVQTEGKGGAK